MEWGCDLTWKCSLSSCSGNYHEHNKWSSKYDVFWIKDQCNSWRQSSEDLLQQYDSKNNYRCFISETNIADVGGFLQV